MLNRNATFGFGQWMDNDATYILENNTGQALVAGDAGAFNADLVNTTYDEWDGAVEGTYLPGHVVMPRVAATTNINGCSGIVIAAEAIASGARGRFRFFGWNVTVRVTGNCAAGDFITVTDNAVGFTTQTPADVLALTAYKIVVGTTLQANASGAAAYIRGTFLGLWAPLGYVGTN